MSLAAAPGAGTGMRTGSRSAGPSTARRRRSQPHAAVVADGSPIGLHAAGPESARSAVGSLLACFDAHREAGVRLDIAPSQSGRRARSRRLFLTQRRGKQIHRRLMRVRQMVEHDDDGDALRWHVQPMAAPAAQRAAMAGDRAAQLGAPGSGRSHRRPGCRRRSVTGADRRVYSASASSRVASMWRSQAIMSSRLAPSPASPVHRMRFSAARNPPAAVPS